MSCRTLGLVTVLTSALAATSACASPDAEPGSSVSATASASATASPTASAPPSTGAGALPADIRTRPEVAAAIADAATRASVPPDEVVVAAWSPVTWNDGSLGCPEKGMVYTQALVEGELLMLRVEQALFQYHSAAGGPFTYCAAPDASYSVTS